MYSEQDIIKKLRKSFFHETSDIYGIGDDCAIIQTREESQLLITTDNLCENIHFDLEYTKPYQLGHKSIIVNVSDIAAMGGLPQYAQIGCALPQNISSDWVDDFITGIKEACQLHNIHLTGGDTTASAQHVFISITMLGTMPPHHHVKLRRTAQNNDIICTTKTMGDASAGLHLLKQKKGANNPHVQKLIERHLCPKAQVSEGLWLSKQTHVHAMMDMSDGLCYDLKRIVEASGCGAVINIEQIPLSNALQKLAVQERWDISSLALSGGEDYSLLFTCNAQHFKNLQKNFRKEFSYDFYAIGHITSNKNQISYLKNGIEITPNLEPYQHFSNGC